MNLGVKELSEEKSEISLGASSELKLRADGAALPDGMMGRDNVRNGNGNNLHFAVRCRHSRGDRGATFGRSLHSGLVFTGLVLGLLHTFEAPHLTKARIFNVFLPGPLFEAAFYIEFKQFWRDRLTVKSKISDRQAETLYQFITAKDGSGKSGN